MWLLCICSIQIRKIILLGELTQKKIETQGTNNNYYQKKNWTFKPIWQTCGESAGTEKYRVNNALCHKCFQINTIITMLISMIVCLMLNFTSNTFQDSSNTTIESTFQVDSVYSVVIKYTT